MSSQVEGGTEEPATVTQPTDGATGSERSVELPLEQVFDVLRNERRRLILVHMADDEGPYTIGELAEHVAAHENDKPVVQLSSDERKRAYVGLYQAHLPKMDAMDIVEFNKSRGRIELGPNYGRVEPYLQGRTTEFDGDCWPRRYLGLSVAAAVLVTLAGLGGATMAWFAATAVVVGFTLTSLYHWRQSPGNDDEQSPVSL